MDGTGVRLSDTALGYTLWTFFMNGFCLLCWAIVARRREASSYLRLHWKKGLLGGVGTMGSYGGLMGDDAGSAGGCRCAA